MPITRRVFLRDSALAVVGTAAIPSFLARAAYGAAEAGSRNKRLVVIFQRGAADGLNIVVPHGEAQYYAMRPSINMTSRRVETVTEAEAAEMHERLLQRAGTVNTN